MHIYASMFKQSTIICQFEHLKLKIYHKVSKYE